VTKTKRKEGKGGGRKEMGEESRAKEKTEKTEERKDNRSKKGS